MRQLGLAAVWNRYARRLENQADRIRLQNVIEHGYDASQTIPFFKLLVEQYGGRSISALWSQDDSNVLRGSFLAIQIPRQYPGADFLGATRDTEAFRNMRLAMGPVKSM